MLRRYEDERTSEWYSDKLFPVDAPVDADDTVEWDSVDPLDMPVVREGERKEQSWVELSWVEENGSVVRRGREKSRGNSEKIEEKIGWW